CPFCPYAQRAADVRRHLQTHFAGDVLWVCCGVPLAEAARYGLPEEVVKSGARMEHDGQVTVGGCGQVLSRRDALQRHLNRFAGKCTGD
ncbi:hypothetical protein BD413DRAFT_441365, partial [Trametes elegans]